MENQTAPSRPVDRKSVTIGVLGALLVVALLTIVWLAVPHREESVTLSEEEQQKIDELGTAEEVNEDDAVALPETEITGSASASALTPDAPADAVDTVATPVDAEAESEVPADDAEEESDSAGVTSITLAAGSNGAMTWSVVGVAANGFKLVWSKNQNPTYPCRDGDEYRYYSDPATRSGMINASDGAGTYYARVCEYTGGGCGTYSNQVSVALTAEEQETSGEVNSITLTASGMNVSWTVDGSSAQGYKVVWSRNQNPTYPCRDGDMYHYWSNPAVSSDIINNAFDGNGTYYVRVCEYLGGACGVYSNQVTVEL